MLLKIEKYFKAILPQKIKDAIKIFLPSSLYSKVTPLDIELTRISKEPRYETGYTNILGKQVKYIDAPSFRFMYDEIFNKEIYHIRTKRQEPFILDCGANVGLSVIYLKRLLPSATIIAFEPDEKAYDALNFNVASLNLENITTVKKAVWDCEETVEFYAEGADAGRISVGMEKEASISSVETVRLKDYLENKKIDFLKIDIEGAEYKVLKDCGDLLTNVENIFIEYHSFEGKEQHLDEILAILKESGFRYIVQHIGIFSDQPFLEVKTWDTMDLQLNIFAIKPNE